MFVRCVLCHQVYRLTDLKCWEVRWEREEKQTRKPASVSSIIYLSTKVALLILTPLTATVCSRLTTQQLSDGFKMNCIDLMIPCLNIGTVLCKQPHGASSAALHSRSTTLPFFGLVCISENTQKCLLEFIKAVIYCLNLLVL